MRTLLRYFHTVRHLRTVQVAGRLWVRLHRPVADLSAPPGKRPRAGMYVLPVSPEPSLVAADTFRFLNEQRACRVGADWRPAHTAKLWRYNLHYFDDLNARDAEGRAVWHMALLQRWVAENPPGQGEAWEPYPVSRRIANWVKWTARGNELPAGCHASLAVQARWLAQRLEYHILGNHLFANAKALVHAGLYFSGPEADRWYSRGMNLIARELREQVLPDGGHFERSSMYHAAVLEDLLDLINALHAYGRGPPPEWVSATARMRRWLSVMSHPDGEIAFFNDAAFGVAPAAAELTDYAARLHLPPIWELPEPLTVLQSSGYVRAIMGPAYLLCDCAAIGPDYLPGHAHADTLSFELCLSGRRLFVNSGTSQYGDGFERQRQRGTAAHNTVAVDGADSSEVWGGFRVARRARARLISAQTGPQGVTVEASHDGYERLMRGGEHTRRWTLDERSLSIEDRVAGSSRSAVAYFHLYPDVSAQVSDAHQVLLRTGREAVRMIFDGAASVHLRPGTWHPRFGVTVANSCVCVSFRADRLRTIVRWGSDE